VKRVPHAECEFPIFGVTLIPTGGSLSRKYPLTPVGGGLEWDSWARIWPPPKGSATAPEVGFGEIAIILPQARFWITSGSRPHTRTPLTLPATPTSGTVDNRIQQ